VDVFEAIRSRRSHRSFRDDPVEREKIDRVLEAAIWAPSPANSQPWEFVVVEGETARKQLIELSERAKQTGTIEIHGYSFVRPVTFGDSAGTEEPEVNPLQRYSLSFLKKVPVMIAVIGNPASRIHQARTESADEGYKYACAAAIQNMLLAAHAQGLGSLWFTFFDRQLVTRFLNLDASRHLVAIVCIGYPDGTPKPPERVPFTAKVRRMD